MRYGDPDHCTISGNSAGEYGGLVNDTILYQYTWGSVTNLYDTIVAGNTDAGSSTASDVVSGNNVTGSYNLIGTGGSGGLTDTDGNEVRGRRRRRPSPPGEHGGQTETIALLPGSPAIKERLDTGRPLPTSDQRGDLLDSPNPDIPAFQSQGFTLSPAAEARRRPRPTATLSPIP